MQQAKPRDQCREPDILALAAAVVSKAESGHPADQALREQFKTQRDLRPGDSTRITEIVFAYFRWRGWLKQSTPLRARLQHAAQLSDQFAHEPHSFRDDELIALAVPDWVKQEVDVTPDWVRALQQPPKLWLRARPGTGRKLAQQLGDCRSLGRGPLEDTLQYQGAKDLFRTAEFRAGAFELQDVSSQAVGLICAPQPGETWWDACAGEGGKTLHLSDLMQNRGLIWSTDRAAWRLQRLKRRAARAKVFNYRVALWEHMEHLPTRTKFDGVLLDAPCSAIGTWGRNPHARWTTTLQDVQELATLQRMLLSQVARTVKPGGKLVYSVCTLARSETIGAADDLQRQLTAFQPASVSPPLAGETTALGRSTFLPQQAGGNGMFVAVWQRQ
jgi:16S rRNA (cytosine967-C5)-methyltransferase